MIVAESRRGRRLVGRLDRGTDVLESLLDVCRAHAVRSGELRAIGELEQVTLSEYDQRGRAWKPPRQFTSPVEIVHLGGNVSEKDGKLFLNAYASVSRQRDNGIELLGGHLVAGRVFSVEFVIEVFDDLLLRRAMDASTGLPLWNAAVALAVEEPAAAVTARAADEQPLAAVPFEAPARAVAVAHVAEAPSWQQVAEASAEVEASAEAETPAAPSAEDARPSPGDWIEHPKFGRCQVERIEGDYEFVSARLRSQRLIR